MRAPPNADAAMRLEKELLWLPEIGRWVSVAVPTVVGVGRPQFTAGSLGRFVRELRAMDATARPAPDAANAFRGVAIAELDERVRWGATVTTEMGSSNRFTAGVDVAGALEIWQEALDAPPWTGAPTWVHGDLLPGTGRCSGDRLVSGS